MKQAPEQQAWPGGRRGLGVFEDLLDGSVVSGLPLRRRPPGGGGVGFPLRADEDAMRQPGSSSTG
jgi:hypothetical protein